MVVEPPAVRPPLRVSQRQKAKINFEELESNSESNGKPDDYLAPTGPSGESIIRIKSPTKKSDTANTKGIQKRRRAKKISKTKQLELAKDYLDVKRPTSLLTDTNLRALLTNQSFAQLQPPSQKMLMNLLPSVDRSMDLLSGSSLNNEFFNRACIEWRERLAQGEFTNEHQTKLKAEAERDKSKNDPWKQKNFESVWGERSKGLSSNSNSTQAALLPMLQKSASEIKNTLESQVGARFDYKVVVLYLCN